MLWLSAQQMGRVGVGGGSSRGVWSPRSESEDVCFQLTYITESVMATGGFITVCALKAAVS